MFTVRIPRDLYKKIHTRRDWRRSAVPVIGNAAPDHVVMVQYLRCRKSNKLVKPVKLVKRAGLVKTNCLLQGGRVVFEPEVASGSPAPGFNDSLKKLYRPSILSRRFFFWFGHALELPFTDVAQSRDRAMASSIHDGY